MTFAPTLRFGLLADQRYEIKVECRELSGTAALRLFWSRPSTPEEVVESIMQQGFNLTFWGQGYTNLAQSGRNSWEKEGEQTPAMDSIGWPTTNATFERVTVTDSSVGIDKRFVRVKITVL